jgi:hypothetical protein
MIGSLFQRVASLVSAPRTTKPVSAVRRARPNLEVLEGRAVPSASPMLSLASSAHLSQQATSVLSQQNETNFSFSRPTLNPVFFHRAPDLRGLDFHLISSNGKPAHDLAIQTEHFSWFGGASFTGTWKGSGGNGTAHAVSDGALHYLAPGKASMTFSWNGTQHFSGTVTWVAPKFNSFHFQLGHWHLEGDVTSQDNPTGGPGHVAGNAYLPILLHQ